MLNLILAFIWLATGVVFLFVLPGKTLGELPLPLYWIAFAMCLFNLVRWWGARMLRKSRLESEEAMARSRRPLRRPGDDREPDPDFRLIDAPPASAPPSRDGLTPPGGNGEPEQK